MLLLQWWALRGVNKLVRIVAVPPIGAAFLLLSVTLGAIVAVGQIARPQPQFGGRGDQDAIMGVYLPTDRALSRAVGRARKRLADREYHEALAFLHNLMGQAEDSFIDSSVEDRMQPGLKATARKMIGDLPPDGLDAYELLQGPAARRQLATALKEGSRDGVARVVRQFFHTAAGYEATLILAQMEADQGHRLAAAQLFRDLIDTPRARARFDPQLSVAAAVNQYAAGRADDAAATIRSLAERMPGAEISIHGRTVSLPPAGSDPLAWLTGLVGEIKSANRSDTGWLTTHGDSSRNVECPGGQPHLRPRWEARVVNEPAIESYLTGRSNDFIQRGVVRIPGARPIAVGDIVIMRTPENVVALDWQTGKRIWETRDEQELDTEDMPADLAPGLDQDQLIAQGRPLEQRMWEDALATALSSDGSRVFVVRGLPATREVESFPWQINPGFGRLSLESSAARGQQPTGGLRPGDAGQARVGNRRRPDGGAVGGCILPGRTAGDRQHAVRHGRDPQCPVFIGAGTDDGPPGVAAAANQFGTGHPDGCQPPPRRRVAIVCGRDSHLPDGRERGRGD
jgi:hypothetical protein